MDTKKSHYIEETHFYIKKYKKVLTESDRRNILKPQQRNSNPSKGRKEVVMDKTYLINGTEYTITDTASGGYTVTESASAFQEEETRYFQSLEEAYNYILNEHVCGRVADPE